MHAGVLLLTCWTSLWLLTGLPGSATAESLNQRECKTYGSGVVQPFNGSAYHVRTSCSFTLTRFTHQGVDCDITAQRGPSGLLTRVEVIVNKIRTVVQDGTIAVETHRVSLPYDHTYQHVFQYGVHTRLRSTVLPLTITWHDTAQGIDALWVQLEGTSISGMSGLCGHLNSPANPPQLVSEAVLEDDTCVIEDSLEDMNMLCAEFLSHAMSCLMLQAENYFHLCQKNAYNHAASSAVTCPFFWDVALTCGPSSGLWYVWRVVTQCPEPLCPGDLTYQELGNAFIPTCSTPTPRASEQDMTSTCICPPGKVLNDRAEGHHCVKVEECPCVYDSSSYPPGSLRRTKCQTCECVKGSWQCSEDICPKRCSIESQFVTSFDGKHSRLPGKCTYVAAQGLNWTLTVHFSERSTKLQRVEFKIYHESYVFSHSGVVFQNEEIRDLHHTALATVFWQSSMYVQVHTHSGLSIQVQMSPEIQVYMSLPIAQNGSTEGLCGNFNGDSGDDFTTSSGIIETSAGPFALSWSLDTCEPNISPICINMDSEIFADEHCNVIRDPDGLFSSCHSHLPYDRYYQACITKTCQCQSGLQPCLCVALGNYAKACASVGASVGDWRTAANCTVTCAANQVFEYTTRVCNRTCGSLAGPDPTCELAPEPVEGCDCPVGTYLNDHGSCSPRSQCQCHHIGGATPPGPALIDGRACICEDGKLNCSEACVCQGGKVCVHCPYLPINTAQKTCSSLSKPASSPVCKTGCYCPEGQYEDAYGDCVSAENCTCVFSGRVYRSGESVQSNCKTCTCGGGHWYCTGQPCPGRCQVFGNGHYQTFDSKWFKFDGNCEYTLVEDGCGSGEGVFAVRVESVPCCDVELTCSRTIIIDLLGEVSLEMKDMSVHPRYYNTSAGWAEMLYSVHTVGLYIVVSVSPLGLTLIWDKHTRLTVLLDAEWRGRVCGLCGNFDSSEANDMLTSGSLLASSTLEFGNSWKTGIPPCKDVISESFPCQRHSYCANWAERRCMIITGDTFKECHLKVDPEPYYQACVLEACSCEFEGKFLGFCTAVAAYAEACSEHNICIRWRTPDLCPVYCDYYNREGQYSWHYDPCGKALTCGRNYNFNGKLEGCYPRCPAEAPYYDENTENCTTLETCTCLFNGTILRPDTELSTETFGICNCTNGTMDCEPYVPTAPPTTPITTTKPPTTTVNTSTTTTELPTTVVSTSTTTTKAPTTTVTTLTTTTKSPTTTVTMSTTTKPPTTTETTSATKSASPSVTTSTTTTTKPTTTTVATSAVTTTTMTPTTTTTTTAIVPTDWPTMEPASTTVLSTTVPSTTTSSNMDVTLTSATTTARPSSTIFMETEITAMPTTTTMKPTSSTSSTSVTVETSTENIKLSTTAATTTTTLEPSTTTISTTIEPTTEHTTMPTTPTTEPTATTTQFISTFKPTTTPSTRTHTEPTATTATTSTPLIIITGPPTITTTPNQTPSLWFPTTFSVATTSTLPTTTTVFPTTAATTTTALEPTALFTTQSMGPTTTKPSVTTTTVPTSIAVSTTSTLKPTSTSSATMEPSTAETMLPTSEPTTALTTLTGFTTEPTAITTTTILTTEGTTTPTTESTTATGATEPTTLKTSRTTGMETMASEMTSRRTLAPTTITSSTVTPEWPTAVYTEATTNVSTLEPTITVVETISVLSTSTTIKPTSTSTFKPTTAQTSTTTTMEMTTNQSSMTTTSTTKPTTTSLSTSTPKETSFPSTVAISLTTSTEPTTDTTVSATETRMETWEPTTESSATSAITAQSATATTPVTRGPTTAKPATTAVQTTSAGPSTLKTTTTTVQTTSITEPVTTTHVSSTTTMEPTTTLCQCRDGLRNKTWLCGEKWTEDCFNKECLNRAIVMTQVTCPESPLPVCPRGRVISVQEGCCPTNKCNCRCEVYGDPHYITFQGTTYDFLENCTYTLVQERLPRYHLSIVVDNYFCIPWLAGSCTKGIMMTFRNHTISLSIQPSERRVAATLDQFPVRPPYEDQGIRFESTGLMVSVYIAEIRSKVSLTPSNRLTITLAMEHFQNNTEGQCGECGGSSCVRPGGERESDSCCPKTASDWIYPDPRKPYCPSAPPSPPRPCDGPPSAPPPTCPPDLQTVCGILHYPEFAPCREVVDLQVLERNCRFDVCSSREPNMACSVLAQAAEECRGVKPDFCVEWRNLTHGICDVTCPDGKLYQECRGQLDDHCSGSLRVSGRVLEEIQSGCFCPKHQLRAGEHLDMCVDSCTDCKGPHGEPKQVGDTWESNCQVCTCDNRTRTTECHPRPEHPPPLCGPDSILVTECCGVQTCAEVKCQYKGVTYKIGDRWSDPSEKCVSFSCTHSGTLQEESVCPKESCPEELRVWDEHHCCYMCDHTCGLRLTWVNLTVSSCFTPVQLPTCEGQCGSRSRWLLEGGVLQLEGACPLCKEATWEEREVYLTCDGHVPMPFPYRHITSCHCDTCSVHT